MGLLARLDAKLDRSGGPDACWPCRGAASTSGRRCVSYPHLQEGGRGSRHWRVCRLVLLLAEIPDARALPEAALLAQLARANRRHRREEAAHACDFSLCGNPAHLQWEDHGENVTRAARRRQARRSAPGDSVITSEMEALAAEALRDLRRERARLQPPPRPVTWWPDPDEEAA